MTETKQTVDISRFNRAERRKLKPQIGITIPGRNLPFERKTHGTVSNYNILRAKELEDEKNRQANNNDS